MRPLVSAVLLVLVAVATGPARAAGPSGVGATASVRVGGHEVTLERRAGEPVLVLRAPAPLGLEETREALAQLLAALAAQGVDGAGVHSLYLGRLERLPWLAERLAEAAARDPGWDAARGRPRAGSENLAVAGLLDRERLHVELDETLAAAGFRVRAASVEKVLVAPASALPFADRLRDRGVRRDARLPFDAQLWLVFRGDAGGPVASPGGGRNVP